MRTLLNWHIAGHQLHHKPFKKWCQTRHRWTPTVAAAAAVRGRKWDLPYGMTTTNTWKQYEDLATPQKNDSAPLMNDESNQNSMWWGVGRIPFYYHGCMRKIRLSLPKERVIGYVAHANYYSGVGVLLNSLAGIPMGLTRYSIGRYTLAGSCCRNVV